LGSKGVEKDVFYYRNANKELKSKLREIVAVNHRLAKTLQERVKTADSQGSPSFPVAVE
jgi:vacuolar-type H+-ATPase subunit F/Vma7